MAKQKIDSAINKLLKDIQKEVEVSGDIVVKELATFIDREVIEDKFDRNFPGHELTEQTIKRKGHGIVGVETGELKRQATKFTNWSIFSVQAGVHRQALTKEATKLTSYALFVRTKSNGFLNYLDLTSKDIANIGREASRIFRRRNFSSSSQIRNLRKRF